LETISVINNSSNPLPRYATDGSSGMDLCAQLEKSVEISPLERVLIGTGIRIALPEGYEAQIRPRSGLALKHGITVLNSPGTIDADYRGEIKVLLINLSDESYTVSNGDRIAQMVVSSYIKCKLNIVVSLPDSVRAEGGYGHTGK
jgi:dUTP pyrophosphatase